MRSALFPRAFSFMVQVKLGKKLLGCPAIGQQSYFLSRAKPGRIPALSAFCPHPPLLLPSQGPSAASAAWTPHSSRPFLCPCLHTHAHSPEGRARRTAHPRSPFLGLGALILWPTGLLTSNPWSPQLCHRRPQPHSSP